jgi:glycosyltransferase involved in cell wall biosynthesis
MKVGFDEQIFLAQKAGGISRYFSQLIVALGNNHSLAVEPIIGWRWTSNRHALDLGLGTRGLDIDYLDCEHPLGRSALYLSNIAAHRRIQHGDLLHHTFYHPRFLRPRFVGPRVVTIYDMTPELFPDLFPGGNPHLAKRSYVDASDMLLCISEATRSDLLQVYGDLGKPVRITYPGVSPIFAPGTQPRTGLPARYLLFVGRRDKYKDYKLLAEALAGLREKIVLVVVGGGPFTDDEVRLHDRLGISPQLVHLSVDDQELAALYSNSLAFVFPSRYEGFGLPTLEAMAAGAPTVLARVSSHPEIGGDAALYFSHGDPESLRDCLTSVIGDPDLRERYRGLGLARAEGFTWAETARQTADAYRELQ